MDVDNPDNECLLECGTSLAEIEHGFERFAHSETPSRLKEANPVGNGSFHAHSTPFSGAFDFDSLRSSISSDTILDDGVNCVMFTSPFEMKNNTCAGSNETTESANERPNATKVPLVYCDQTASNRPVKSIERYLERVCLPMYGNTHTNTSITGSQSTAFVSEARQIVAEECNAKISGKASLDVVLFAGSGTTAAVELLIDCLGLKHACKDVGKRPVVFIGPYEHHSNLLPWRESGCEVVMIPECPKTRSVDYAFLERSLQSENYQHRIMRMGTFTAASNVSGRVSDVNRIASILHRHGALAFFDYATAAPYMPMDMNPPASEDYPSSSLVAMDAIFFSPHKMIGGVGTPGVLVVKKHLVNQANAPSRAGGGTVFYVSHSHHRFLGNRIERYEGGTQNIVGIMRVGLAFLFKRRAEERYRTIRSRMLEEGYESKHIPQSIEEADYATHGRVVSYLREHAPNLILLGHPDQGKHLPIFSFLIRFGNRFLHYNYVCAVLNDIFGIQSRGGCQCAGPYSQQLLGLTNLTEDGEVPNRKNRDIEKALLDYKERAELLRPGYTRVSLPFKGLQSAEIDYVLHALVWVAKHGWALMCQYRCNHRTGEWRHYNRQGKPLGRFERRWLSHYHPFESGGVLYSGASGREIHTVLRSTLENADVLLSNAMMDQSNIVQARKMTGADNVLGKEEGELEELRWYAYPKECADELSSPNSSSPRSLDVVVGALDPERLRESEGLEPNPYRNSDHMHHDEEPVDKMRRANAVENDTEEIAHKPTENDTEEIAQKVGKGLVSKRVTRDSMTWGQGSCIQQQSINIPSDSAHDNKKRRFLHVQPPAKLMRLINQALVQWNMIENGDRLLLGLSGGKDSLSLLHCLLEFKRKMPVRFELQVCTIDPMTPSFDPSRLIPYVEALGLKYHYIRDDIVSRASSSGKGGSMVKSLCAFCARMKRGNLYACARANNCNKLVLAQHLDDCAESFMMSVMHNGFLRTMKANYKINAGDISVIRPMIYCRESFMTDFAKSANLPVINENCPACFEEPKERARTKKLLSREETLYPNFYDNIRRSLIPLMHEDATAILRGYTEEVVARSRKENRPRYHAQIAQLETEQGPMTTTSEECLNHDGASLSNFSDEVLMRELARRKADQFRLSGAMKRLDDDPEDLACVLDETGQVCTLNGEGGTIPCRELME